MADLLSESSQGGNSAYDDWAQDRMQDIRDTFDRSNEALERQTGWSFEDIKDEVSDLANDYLKEYEEALEQAKDTNIFNPEYWDTTKEIFMGPEWEPVRELRELWDELNDIRCLPKTRNGIPILLCPDPFESSADVEALFPDEYDTGVLPPPSTFGWDDIFPGLYPPGGYPEGLEGVEPGDLGIDEDDIFPPPDPNPNPPPDPPWDPPVPDGLEPGETYEVWVRATTFFDDWWFKRYSPLLWQDGEPELYYPGPTSAFRTFRLGYTFTFLGYAEVAGKTIMLNTRLVGESQTLVDKGGSWEEEDYRFSSYTVTKAKGIADLSGRMISGATFYTATYNTVGGRGATGNLWGIACFYSRGVTVYFLKKGDQEFFPAPPPPKPEKPREEGKPVACCNEQKAILRLLREVHKVLDPKDVEDSVIPNKWLRTKARGNHKMKTYPELFEALFRMLDKSFGHFPQRVEIPGGANVEVHTTADFLKQIMQALIDVEQDSDRNGDIMVRLMQESLIQHQLAVKNHAWLEGIAEFLDYKQRDRKESVKMMGNPLAGAFSLQAKNEEKAEDILKRFLKESRVDVTIAENVDKKTLTDYLLEIKRAAVSAAQALTMEAGQGAFDKLLRMATLHAKMERALHAPTMGDLDFNDAVDAFERQYPEAQTGRLTDITKPYGAESGDRPKVREIDGKPDKNT